MCKQNLKKCNMNFRALTLAFFPIQTSAQLVIKLFHFYNAYEDPSLPPGVEAIYDDAGEDSFVARSGDVSTYFGFPDGLFDIVFDTYNNMDFIIADNSNVTFPGMIIPPGRAEHFYYDFKNRPSFSVMTSAEPNFNVTTEVVGCCKGGIPIPFTNDYNTINPGRNVTYGDTFKGNAVIKVSILEGTDLSMVGSKFRHKVFIAPPMSIYSTITDADSTGGVEMANALSVANDMRLKDAKVPNFPPFADDADSGLFLTEITGDTVTMTVTDVSGMSSTTLDDETFGMYFDTYKDIGFVSLENVDLDLKVTLDIIPAGTPITFPKMDNINEFLPSSFQGGGFSIKFSAGTNFFVGQSLSIKYYEPPKTCDDMIFPSWPRYLCTSLPKSSCTAFYNSTHVYAQVCPTKCGVLGC